MAVTAVDGNYLLTAAGDTLPLPGEYLINALVFTSVATAGQATVRIGDASGPLLWQINTAVNTTHILTFTVPLRVHYLELDAKAGASTDLLVLIV